MPDWWEASCWIGTPKVKLVDRLSGMSGSSEGRRRNRKRDQTPDAFGLGVKRELLQRVVEEDPDADTFEAWLLNYPLTCKSPELVGPASAMARAVYEDWRLAHSMGEFRTWLEQGAPSDDAFRT